VPDDYQEGDNKFNDKIGKTVLNVVAAPALVEKEEDSQEACSTKASIEGGRRRRHSDSWDPSTSPRSTNYRTAEFLSPHCADAYVVLAEAMEAETEQCPDSSHW
jgi:hypothetical protein